MSTARKFDKAFFHDYFYLFFVNLLMLSNNNPESYEESQRGYFLSMLNAMNTAFATTLNRQITPEFTKTINGYATEYTTQHLNGNSATATRFKKLAQSKGAYRKESRPLHIITAESNLRVKPNGSSEGLKEFVDYWLLKNAAPVHTLLIESNLETLNIIPTPASKSVYVRQTEAFSTGKVHLQRTLDLADEGLQRIFQGCRENTRYMWHLNPAHPLCITKIGYPKGVVDALHQNMIKIHDEYNHEILLAHDAKEKIAVIVRFVQHLIQLQPFTAQNLITSNIVLLRLLDEEKLPLALIEDMSRFEGCANAELVEDVLRGQKRFADFVQLQQVDKTWPRARFPYAESAADLFFAAICRNLPPPISVTIYNLGNEEVKLDNIDPAQTTISALYQKYNEHTRWPLTSQPRFFHQQKILCGEQTVQAAGMTEDARIAAIRFPSQPMIKSMLK